MKITFIYARLKRNHSLKRCDGCSKIIERGDEFWVQRTELRKRNLCLGCGKDRGFYE